MLNYAVACGSLPSNPVEAVKLLRKPNVRRSVLDDAAFEKLFTAAEAQLKPIILVAYEGVERHPQDMNLFKDSCCL